MTRLDLPISLSATPPVVSWILTVHFAKPLLCRANRRFARYVRLRITRAVGSSIRAVTRPVAARDPAASLRIYKDTKTAALRHRKSRRNQFPSDWLRHLRCPSRNPSGNPNPSRFRRRNLCRIPIRTQINLGASLVCWFRWGRAIRISSTACALRRRRCRRGRRCIFTALMTLS